MPVGGVCVRVHLLREPLQVAGDVVFEPLAVVYIGRERAAVTYQRVHPVLVDQLRFKEHHITYTQLPVQIIIVNYIYIPPVSQTRLKLVPD